MAMIPLHAAPRPKISLSTLRRDGEVPCILYGFGVESTPLECQERELTKVYAQAGKNTLVELTVEERKVPILLQALQLDPVSDRPIHADFYAVNLHKEVEASVPVHFEGVAPAIRDLGGILVTPLTSVRVKCLPTVLPHSLSISIETLTEIHSMLKVRDLLLPNGVRVLDAPDSVVALIQEVRVEEEAPAASAVVPGVEGVPPEEGGEEGEGGAERNGEEENEAKKKTTK